MSTHALSRSPRCHLLPGQWRPLKTTAVKIQWQRRALQQEVEETEETEEAFAGNRRPVSTPSRRLWSNLNPETLKHEPGSVVGAAALVAGTTVGAGILALPAVTQVSRHAHS